MPIIAAGGVWDHDGIGRMMELGASGVQLGTRFIGTVECDASDVMKQTIIGAKEEDIKLFKSPVGYPARGVKTELHTRIEPMMVLQKLDSSLPVRMAIVSMRLLQSKS